MLETLKFGVCFALDHEDVLHQEASHENVYEGDQFLRENLNFNKHIALFHHQ
jgi:hypothetical protein